MRADQDFAGGLARGAIVVAVLAVGALTAAAALPQTLYKSVAPDGSTVYSDLPPATGKVEKTLRFVNPPSSDLPSQTAMVLERLRKAIGAPSVAAPVAGVVLFSASWCGYCKLAKSYLSDRRISYREVDIDTRDGLSDFARAGGGKGIPLLVAGRNRVQGFSPAAYDDFFGKGK
jgi:glutaredoxin